MYLYPLLALCNSCPPPAAAAMPAAAAAACSHPPTRLPWDSGRVLGPPPRDSDSWDRIALAGPVVVRHPTTNSLYRMYYYGRDRDAWNMGVTPFNATLPTGRIGLAMSQDGIHFQRFKGPLQGGALMDPSDDPTAFDCVHIGVSDAFFRADEGKWYMYYFGGGLDEHPVVGFPDRRRCKGVRLQAGLALSEDGIHIKERKGPVLKVGVSGSWDENGVSWPRVLRPWSHGEHLGATKEKWLLSYHTRESGGPNNLGFFSAGVAVSDDGVQWEKKGKVLGPGAPGSWDEGGVSVRHVIRHDGKFLMFYEGSNYSFEFAIGLAISEDGLVWNKDTECGPEPGGPVLKPRKGEDFWDNFVVGTPYVISVSNGSLRMYYLGIRKMEGETTLERGIGLALSDGSNFRVWKRYSSIES